jgi:protein-S-isoprenylcysteine O-methyltransferase Ste14
MEPFSLMLAALLFAGHFAAEPLLRRGRAKKLLTSSFEGWSTLLVTALGLASVVGSFAARFTLECGRFTAYPWLVVSLGLSVFAGVALRYWSMLTLGEFFTRTLIVLPGHSIVTAGPYRVVRHPGYLAQLVVLTAVPLLLSISGSSH